MPFRNGTYECECPSICGYTIAGVRTAEVGITLGDVEEGAEITGAPHPTMIHVFFFW